MTAHFCLATSANLATLMQYMREFHEFDHTEPFDEETAAAAMEKVVTDKNIGRVWLIQQSNAHEQAHEQTQKTVGYMVITFSYRLEYRGYYAFLDELYLRAESRGQGLGTQALNFLKAECQRLGVKVLQLEVKQDNPQAAALYNKVGFIPQLRTVFTQSLT